MSACIQREQAVIKHCLLAIDTACTKASPGRCFFFKGSSVVFGAGCDTQQPHTAPLVSQCLPTRRTRAPGAHSPSGRSRGEGGGRCACALVSLPFFTRPSPGRAAAPSPGGRRSACLRAFCCVCSCSRSPALFSFSRRVIFVRLP